MYWLKFCIGTPNRTFVLIFDRLLVYPLVDAFAAEGCLTLLTLHRLHNNFQTNLTNKKWLKAFADCISWAQIGEVGEFDGVVGLLQNQIVKRLPLINMQLCCNVLKHTLVGFVLLRFLILLLQWNVLPMR